MSLFTSDDYSEYTGVTYTGSALVAVNAACAAVEAAIRRYCGQEIGLNLYTAVLDAPYKSRTLQLPQWPVTAVTSLHLNWDARGNPAAFTSEFLLTPYTDYRLVIDDVSNNRSKRGKVEILSRPYWAYWPERPLGMVASRMVDAPGAVYVTWQAGYSEIPDDLIQAGCLAVSMMYNRRMGGMPSTNESWNGYSVGFATPFAAAAALNTPDIQNVLRQFGNMLSIG